MSLCIQYSRPDSGQEEGEVYGLDVAVTRFLSAWFRYGTARPFLCRPTTLESFDHFKEVAASQGIDAEKDCIGLDPRHPEKNLQTLSCIFRPDPLTADLVWRRVQMRGSGFATCGLVHTMSGERIAQAACDLMLAPSDATDALICPSQAIGAAVRNLWDIQADYFKHRFGGSFTCPVQTPVLPIGIDTQIFEGRTTPEKRQAQRAQLNSPEDEIIILFVGRLSFATKAHPLPLLMAADRAARGTKKRIRLVLYGYFKPKDMETPFRALAADYAGAAQVTFVQNGDPRFPDGLWAAADIFASLSDNVQESFGLTPLEAMASGLPAVVSDWDGYREGIRNGEEGFLIPTLTPPESAGMALAQTYYNEGNYGVALTAAAQSTAIDVDEAARAFSLLATDANLRSRMGEKGRARARAVFDWQPVMRSYEALWADLAEKRRMMPRAPATPENWAAAHPSFPNPWRMFARFPTTPILPTDILHAVMGAEEVTTLLKHEMNFFVPALLVPRETLLELIALIRRAGSVHVQDLLAPFPTERQDSLWRCIGWMVKYGVCRLQRVGG